MRQSDDGSGVVTLAACTLCPSRFDQTLCYLSHRNRTCCHSTGGRRWLMRRPRNFPASRLCSTLECQMRDHNLASTFIHVSRPTRRGGTIVRALAQLCVWCPQAWQHNQSRGAPLQQAEDVLYLPLPLTGAHAAAGVLVRFWCWSLLALVVRLLCFFF